MNALLLIAVLLTLSAVGYHIGRKRALALVDHPRRLNSLPGYYGSWVLLWCLVPSLVVILAWQGMQSTVVDGLVVASLPAEVQELPQERLGLFLNDAKNLATGNIVSTEVDETLRRAADRYTSARRTSSLVRAALVLLLCVGGIAIARRLISTRLRAMHRVEAAFKIILMTGYAGRDRMRDLDRCPFPVLRKPFDQDQLVTVLRKGTAAP